MGWKSSKKRTFTQIYCVWVWLSHSSQTASESNSVQSWPSSANLYKSWSQAIPTASRKMSSWVLDEWLCWCPDLLISTVVKSVTSHFRAKALPTQHVHQQEEIRSQQICHLGAGTHLGRRRKREFPQDGPVLWWTPLSVQPLDAGLLQQKGAGDGGGKKKKREIKIIKLCPRRRSKQQLISKTHPFVRIGHTL